jgi:hypothetical protein
VPREKKTDKTKEKALWRLSRNDCQDPRRLYLVSGERGQVVISEYPIPNFSTSCILY